MLRTTLVTTLISASLLGACTDEMAGDDTTASGDGKADGWGVSVERKVLEESHQPSNVLQDATHVYYMVFTEEDSQNDPQTHSVMRVRRSDGKLDKLATIPGFPNHAALGGSFIYYSTYDGIYKLAKSGGQAQLVIAGEGATAIAADATAVYYAMPAIENETYFHRITKLVAGTTTPIELGRATYVTGLGVDDTNVYWLDETLPNPAVGCGQNAGFAHKVSKLGGADITLQAGINCPLSLTVDSGANLYYASWAPQANGSLISKLSKFGGVALPLGSLGAIPIVTDAVATYWVSPNGNLMRQAKAFGLPRVVTSNVHDVVAGADVLGLYYWREQAEPRMYSLYRIGQ